MFDWKDSEPSRSLVLGGDTRSWITFMDNIFIRNQVETLRVSTSGNRHVFTMENRHQSAVLLQHFIQLNYWSIRASHLPQYDHFINIPIVSFYWQDAAIRVHIKLIDTRPGPNSIGVATLVRMMAAVLIRNSLWCNRFQFVRGTARADAVERQK